MLFRLAEHLHKSVGEIEATMEYEEYRQWFAYFKIKNKNKW